MRTFTIFSLLTLTACVGRHGNDLGSLDDPADGLTDDLADTGDLAVPDDEPLIPELSEGVDPDPDFPVELDPEDGAPAYDVLAGIELSVLEQGPWVLRAGGGVYGRGLGGGPSGYAEMEACDMAVPLASSTPSRRSRGGGRDSAMAPPTSAGAATSIARPMPQEAASALKAGSTDDNAAFGAYLEFLAEWSGRPEIQGQFQPTDVSGRSYVSVTDAAGVPVPGAVVHIASDGELVQVGETLGDGTTPFYPAFDLASGSRPTADSYEVLVEVDGRREVRRWDGDEPLRVQLDSRVLAEPAVPLDALFLIDTTGSMADEIDRIKKTLLAVTDRLEGLDRPVDLRYAAVLYRDLGDEYVTKRHDFTIDVQGFSTALQGISANGGGDGPESLNQGLAEAVHGVEWRDVSAKVIFLVADAPPHMDYEGDRPYATSAMDAVAKGIRVHTVAASGLDSYGGAGSLVFRQTSQLTQGDFVFIEYGSSAASAASHGVSGPVANNNLDAILYDKLEDEVQGWRERGGAWLAMR